MSESEPTRPRFRLQTLVLVVVILGLGAGLIVQQLQIERLKLQVAIERAKALDEAAMRRQAEMETRKMQNELYAIKKFMPIDLRGLQGK
jgi:hypothetical protein